MVSILLQRRNIIKCIFKQQLPTPALQIPARPPVCLHLIAQECAGMPQAGLKNTEFPCYFRRSQMTLVSYILSLVDHCYSFTKQRNGKVGDLTISFFHHFYYLARKHTKGGKTALRFSLVHRKKESSRPSSEVDIDPKRFSTGYE